MLFDAKLHEKNIGEEKKLEWEAKAIAQITENLQWSQRNIAVHVEMQQSKPVLKVEKRSVGMYIAFLRSPNAEHIFGTREASHSFKTLAFVGNTS